MSLLTLGLLGGIVDRSLLLIVGLLVEVIEHIEEDGILSDGEHEPAHWVAFLEIVEEYSVGSTDGEL